MVTDYSDLPPELREQIEADEQSDREEFIWIKVRDFAKSRNVAPQLVYYYIRNGKLSQSPCPACGTPVISRKDASELFNLLDAKVQEKRSGVNHVPHH